MLDSSWKATKLVRPIWQRLTYVEKERREELSRLTGIPATNLSAMNTGNMSMTPQAASRIVNAVNEKLGTRLTILDLGAPADVAVSQTRFVQEQLDELARKLSEAERLLDERLAALEEWRGRVEAPPTGRRQIQQQIEALKRGARSDN